MADYTSPNFDELFAGGIVPERMTAIIIQSGAGVVTRGTVLAKVGQVAEGDLYAGTPICVPVNSAGTKPGETEPYAISADPVIDATAADVRGASFLDGEFNRDFLKFGGSDKVADHEDAMRKIGLITKRVVK
ncbi:head decoration protein [Paenibacillus hubeiensis]|uniref:head decoration protein n=1 Tax=Paenibacillus hubeiensis TaxID=3077330 RepID=UPI0031B9FE64